MEAKHYAIKQLMSHWRNQRGNQKIPKDKWSGNRVTPNLQDIAKAFQREKFIAI